MPSLKPETIVLYQAIISRVGSLMDQKAPDGRMQKYTSSYVYQTVAVEFKTSVGTVRRAWFSLQDIAHAVVTNPPQIYI